MIKIKIDFEDKKKLKFGKFYIKYKGLIFYKDNVAGNESIQQFLIENDLDWKNQISQLYGNFILNISYNDINYIFTDNMGAARLYYYKDYVFDKMIDFINFNKFNKNDINNNGIVEYLQFGYPMFNTFIKGINKLNRSDMICWKKDKINIESKKLISIFENKNDIEKFYSNFESNFKNLSIVCDLTAGIDSRLNVSLLKGNNLKFKTSISGLDNHIDVIKCKEISRILNVKNLYYKLDNEIDEKIVDEMFIKLDGQYSVLEYYKNYILTEGLIKDKINLRISGAGGELYKYSWMMTDFPYFNKKNFSLNKIYNNRYRTKSILYNFYTESFINIINNYQKILMSELEKYKRGTNVKTYDNLCYETIMMHGVSTQLIHDSNDFVRYCPLLEPNIVSAGINQSVKDRILYKLHRKIITKNTSCISKIKTNLNLTVDSSFVYVFRDGLCLISRYFKRLINKILKKSVVKKDNANSKKIYGYMKSHDKGPIKILEKNNILSPNFDSNRVDEATYSRLITIAKLYEIVGK